MSSRVDLIKDSLESSDIDSVLYSMIADMSADEWLYVLQNKEQYEVVLPFLLIAYNPEIIDALVELTNLDFVVTELMEQWFLVYFYGDHDMDAIDVMSVAERPCLNALYSGHLLGTFAKSSQDEAVSDFVRTYTRELTRKLLAVLKENPEDTMGFLAGTIKPNSAYPLLSDWDEDELGDSLSFLYFLSSIELAVEMLGLGDSVSLKRRELLMEGKIDEVIETSSLGSLQKRRNIRDFSDVEAFVVEHYQKFEHALSDFILESNEIVYLESLLAQGKVESLRCEVLVEDVAESASIEIGSIDESPDAELFGSLTDGSPNKETHGEERGFIESLKGLFELPKTKVDVFKNDTDDVLMTGDEDSSPRVELEEESVYGESSPVPHEAPDFNDLVQTRKKKGSPLLTWMLVGGVVMLALFLLLSAKASDEQTSIIDKHSEAASNDYQVVFIDE